MTVKGHSPAEIWENRVSHFVECLTSPLVLIQALRCQNTTLDMHVLQAVFQIRYLVHYLCILQNAKNVRQCMKYLCRTFLRSFIQRQAINRSVNTCVPVEIDKYFISLLITTLTRAYNSSPIIVL
jgi:hypothetical protein